MHRNVRISICTILHTKTTGVQNEVGLSYHRIIFSGSCFYCDYRYMFEVQSYQLKLMKFRAKLASLNHCAVAFLSRAGANLYYYSYLTGSALQMLVSAILVLLARELFPFTITRAWFFRVILMIEGAR